VWAGLPVRMRRYAWGVWFVAAVLVGQEMALGILLEPTRDAQLPGPASVLYLAHVPAHPQAAGLFYALCFGVFVLLAGAATIVAMWTHKRRTQSTRQTND
jgi:hypothetical protein